MRIRFLILAISAFIGLLAPKVNARELSRGVSPSTNDTPVNSLVKGVPLQLQVSGTSAPRLSISVSREQFLVLKISPAGAHVDTKMFGPDQKEIVDADCPGAEKGSNWYAFVATLPGEYILSLSPSAKARKPEELTVELIDLRDPTEADRERWLGQKAFWDAQILYNKNTGKSAWDSVARFQESLDHFRKADSLFNQAFTLDAMAVAYRTVSEHEKALELYNQSLPMWRALGDERMVGHSLTRIGVIKYQLGDIDQAIEYYKQGLARVTAAGDRFEEQWTLNVLGVANYSQSNYEEAISYYQQAYNIALEIEEIEGQSVGLKNLAHSYAQFGDYKLSLDYQSRALELAKAIGNDREEGVVLLGNGLIYEQMGDFRKALEQFDAALEIIRRVGDRNLEAQVLDYTGRSYSKLGDNANAEKYYQQALVLAQTLHDRIGEGLILGDLALVYRLQGDCAHAIQIYGQAIPILKGVGNSGGLATAYGNLSICQSLNNQMQPALKSTESAIEIIETTRAKFSGRDLRTSYFASQGGFYTFYSDLLMKMNVQNPGKGYDALALQAVERAHARVLVDLLSEAKVDVNGDADPALIAEERRLRSSIDSKLADRRALFTSGDKSGATASVDMAIDDLVAKYRQIQSKLRLSSPHYASLTLPGPLSLKEIQDRVVDADTLLLEYSLGEDHSYVFLVSHDSIQTFELASRDKIGPVAHRFCELLSARGRTIKFETKEERADRLADAEIEYRKVASELSEMILGPVADLLGKKRLLVVSDGALNFVPFAALPLPVKPKPRGRASGENRADETTSLLIANHEIVNIPSASALAEIRRDIAARPQAPLSLAVFADPVFERNDPRVQIAGAVKKNDLYAGSAQLKIGAGMPVGQRVRSAYQDVAETTDGENIPRLPFTRQEANAIVAMAPKGTAKEFLDFNASRGSAVNGGLNKYRYIHFATHGLLNNNHPEVSGVLLSMVGPDGQDQNGFLTTHDVFGLKLPADLIVLSSCKSGLGKNFTGEGMVGLTRGFMYAGAARVMVSLWDVNDEATAVLMTHFYAGVLERHLTPATALREAQLALMRETKWKSPYYWAGFVLQGEPK